MKRLRWLTIVMLLTLLIITGFQIYWLADNFQREDRSLRLKTQVAFSETVEHLQAVKLKLPGIFDDSSGKGKTRIFINENVRRKADDTSKSRQIITLVNSMKEKISDTFNFSNEKSAVVIAFNKSRSLKKDSVGHLFRNYSDSGNRFYKILYGLDSLQDSLRIPEIMAEYSAALKKQNIEIPFTVSRFTQPEPIKPGEVAVTMGFAHPVIYKMKLLNTTSYVFKRISLPILFSFFLLAVTIFSFVLLYRNLLKQQRLAEIKDEFISNITHELKTPIATVTVAIEALKNFNAIHDPQKTKEYLDISGNELQRLGLLVDKVLKLSMFEKQQIELSKENFDLKLLVQEVLDSLRPQFAKQEADVNFIAAGENFTINADKLHITSVIYNLLDNALKYSNEKPVIDVHLSKDDDALILKVSDKGIGIAHEYRNKIFDKFFRVPTGNKHSVKGYGLGLSYVAEIVKRHNGSIEVESEPGKGSTFAVTFKV